MKNLSLFRKLFLFVLPIFIGIVSNSCRKEYSCENCGLKIIDTTISIRDTAWRFNIESNLYFGSSDFSAFIYDKHGFTFYGYSQHLPGGILEFGCRIDPLYFNQNLNNLTVTEAGITYGRSTLTNQPVLGFKNKPNGLNVKIKNFDISTNTVECTFEGIVLGDNGNDIVISNGRLKIKVN